MGLRGGEALRCIHAADDPAGCGFGVDCQNCALRSAIANSFDADAEYYRQEATLQVNRAAEVVDLYFILSTSVLHLSGERLVLVTLDDITELKRIENALRRSEERYTLAQRAANIGSWDWDILSGDLVWSERIEPMFGYARGEFGRTYEAFLDCVYPDDREYVQVSVAAAVEEDKAYDIEHRIVWPDGTIRWVSETGDVIRDENGRAVRMLGIVQDITVRKRFEEHQKLATDILSLLNKPVSRQTDLIREVLTFIKESTGIEAVGIRLEADGDYPYYVTSGFPSHFIEMERYLCYRDAKGEVVNDPQGDPVLECMCGNVIRGRTDSSSPFFTPGGSFWTNSTSKLLSTTTEADRRTRTRNRCNGEGYESVALIPLRSIGKNIGLLQLNDRRTGMFTLEMIEYLEGLGESIGIALGRKQAEESLQRRTSELAQRVKELNCLYGISTLVDQIGISMEEIFEKTVQMIPTALQHPHVAGARVTVERKEYQSADFRETSRCQSCPIIAHGQEVGRVDVCYLEEIPQSLEGPFSKEEQRLLNSIAETLGTVIEKMLIENALRASERNYRTLVEASPDGIITINDKGYVTDCNQGISKLLGYSQVEILGKNIRELVPYRVPADLMAYYSDAEVDGQVENEFQLINREGNFIPVWVKMVPIYDAEKNFREFVLYLRDVAERQRIDQLKDEFIGLVSHELRNPLTVLIGAINTILVEKERLSTEETHQLLSDAALEAESLSHLIGNLLELSRFQSDRLLLYPEPINIHSVIEQTVANMQRQHDSHRFQMSIPNDIPPIRADQLRLERILYNLLENATKYSPEGTVVAISVNKEKTHLIIGVSDQGEGIPPQEQLRLFEPFQRLGHHELSGITGIGLGLSVCRRLVEAHGGLIWVESEPGQGSTFFFTLPLR